MEQEQAGGARVGGKGDNEVEDNEDRAVVGERDEGRASEEELFMSAALCWHSHASLTSLLPVAICLPR